MKMNHGVAMRGKLNIDVYSADGALKDHREITNLVVQSGKVWMAQRMAGEAVPNIGFMALGTGTAAAVVEDSALKQEVFREPLKPVVREASAVTFTAVFGPGKGTGAITEAGLFNASTAGVLLARTVFGVITKEAGDTMSISWSVTPT